MKVSISSAIDWSKMGPAMRNQLLSDRLVQDHQFVLDVGHLTIFGRCGSCE